jgi:hypothetical protein
MKRRYLYYSLGAGVLTPLLVMMLTVGRDMTGGSLKGYSMIVFLSLIPFLVLIGIVFSTNLKGARLACVFWFGFIAVWGFTVYGHWSVWTSRSSTAALSLFIIPVYAFVPLAIGLLVGWGVSLLVRETEVNREKKIDREADWKL